MKNTRTKTAGLAAATALAVAALLSACGGGSSTDAPVIVPPVVVPPVVVLPVTAVPDSAGVSVSSFITFLLSLGMTDETSEPLTISSTFAAPTDDAAEPTAL